MPPVRTGPGFAEWSCSPARNQAAHVIFGEANPEEAEDVAARFEAMAADFPPRADLAKVIREPLATINHNKGAPPWGSRRCRCPAILLPIDTRTGNKA